MALAFIILTQFALNLILLKSVCVCTYGAYIDLEYIKRYNGPDDSVNYLFTVTDSFPGVGFKTYAVGLNKLSVISQLHVTMPTPKIGQFGAKCYDSVDEKVSCKVSFGMRL